MGKRFHAAGICPCCEGPDEEEGQMKAESVKLVEESEGFELHVVDDHGETHLFNVHGCTHDLIAVGRKLADYWAEGRRLAAEHERLEWAASCEEFGQGLGEIDGGGE